MSRTYAQQKSALTRAERSGDPKRVIAECERTFAEWDRQGRTPDGWHRWTMASHTAEFEIARSAWDNGFGGWRGVAHRAANVRSGGRS